MPKPITKDRNSNSSHRSATKEPIHSTKRKRTTTTTTKTTNASTNNTTANASISVTVNQRRSERKQQRKKETKQQLNKKCKSVCGVGKESFWEIEQVVGRRMKGGRVQYLVRWKGFPEAENTWEPAENLCNTAMSDAVRFTKMMNKRKLELNQAEELLLAPDRNTNFGIPIVKSAEAIPDEVLSNMLFHGANAGVDDEQWAWTDKEQINFRQVERINVHDSDAKERVTTARVYGTPVILVGHVGWANFAKPWLEQQPTSSEQMNKDTTWLDLAKPHCLIIEKMIQDIGDEEVPVVRRNYNEANPIHADILASKFLTSCWSIPNEPSLSTAFGAGTKLYLHQWQFPLSDTAGRKLCHQNNPLPNDILGEDLLKYWLDLPQCQGDSPLQYLFMGREETLSKMHRDNGGLTISIAPIVGEKECLLVHRSDGANCLYHLNAKLDDVDLHTYPLLAQARIWKTVVHPGEILILPQGTYHQCRNITPCLSYSRFHLDTVNLLAFLQSKIDGDAPEIEHDLILWNSATELIRNVDFYFDTVRTARRRNALGPIPQVSSSMVKMVDTLRSLRHICRELSRRGDVQNTFNGNNVPGRSVYANKDFKETKLPPIAAAAAPSFGTNRVEHDWKVLVDDIDICLHEFRYRKLDRIPRFRSRLETLKDKAPLMEHGRDEQSADSQSGADATIEVYATDIESAFLHLPYASTPKCKDKALATTFDKDDDVVVHLQGRRVEGTIVEICTDLDVAYLSYDGYPVCYDEYQPFEKLRSSFGGDMAVEIPREDVKPGIVVMVRWGDHGDEYRAIIRHTTSTEKFLKVRLILGHCRILRWLPESAIVKKM